MRRTLARSLERRPLFFEPVPPSARATPARILAYVSDLTARLAAVPRLDAADIPELVDENHDGRPYYRSGDTRAFARTIAERSGLEVVVNKVVAHLPSADALAGWARESVERGCPHLVLVGGSSRYIPYPGPTVLEANRVVRPVLEPVGGLLGNIAIPQRTGEAHRMLGKTRAGAAFFTTQILFDSESVLRLAREYEGLCRQAGRPPAALLLSVAPLADDGDAEFVRWLGADIPESAERAILNGDEAGAAARSIAHALKIWGEVVDGAAHDGLEMALGINVEQITQRHLGSAIEMLQAFATAIDGDPPGPPAVE